MHFYDEKPRKEMGFFGMELDQRNRGQRAVEGKTLVTGCKEMKLSNTQGKKFYPNFTLEKIGIISCQMLNCSTLALVLIRVEILI